MLAPTPSALTSARFATSTRDTAAAAAELRAACPDDAALTFVFASAAHDLEVLGEVLAALPGAVAGCTTAGEIGPSGYQSGGITALFLCGPGVRATSWVVDAQTLEGLEPLREGVMHALWDLAPLECAGILLADGLARQEERIAAAIYTSLPGVPIVGASAGDDLRFAATAVFDGQRFTSGQAVFTLLMANAPITTFRFQHHEPAGCRMVVTAADPASRTVWEIDGHPALEAYARAIGVDVADLGDASEAATLYPLMMRVGTEHFLRSIQSFGPHGAIHFYCAISPGTVLRVGRPVRPHERLRQQLERISSPEHPLEALLVFDCVLRRLEFVQGGTDALVGALLAEAGAVGFSTYGEQYGPLHVNQTLVGLAIGRPAP